MTNDQRAAIAEMLTIICLIVTALWSFPLVVVIVYQIATLGQAFTLAGLVGSLQYPSVLIWLSTLTIVVGSFRLRRWAINQIEHS